jgi:hypothetical protein
MLHSPAQSGRPPEHEAPVPPRYPLPLAALIPPVVAGLDGPRGAPRPFRRDALALTAGLRAALEVSGSEHIPAAGPCVLTPNHYHRPGFNAAWIVLAISALVPAEVHWVMTAEWTYRGWRAGWALRPLSRWLLGRIARLYGFTAMPAMPPDPGEAAARAGAVRALLARARRLPPPLLGIAPEGRDVPAGALGWPPPGAGRLFLRLAALGFAIVPVGLYERSERLCVAFGPRYALAAPGAAGARERDEAARRTLMEHIAALLPPERRGPFVPAVAPAAREAATLTDAA